MTTTTYTICGRTIEADLSGIGQGWRVCGQYDIPANIVTEIECEMLDGGRETCDRFVASNGIAYRW